MNKSSIQAINPPESISGGFSLEVMVHNASNEVWESSGSNPVNVAYHWLDEDWNMVVFDGIRTPLPQGGIPQGGTAKITAQIAPPPNPGKYRLLLSLVKEGMGWFEPIEAFRPHIFQIEFGRQASSATDSLRVLFFLEPVVYGAPAFLACHLFWAEMFAQATEAGSGQFALAANREVVAAWKQDYSQFPNSATFPLDSGAPLQPFGGDRREYSKALYKKPLHDNPLTEELGKIRETYQPNLVVYTSQNSFAKTAFDGIASLHIEQAPLPRLGHPARTSFDPLGHQVGSMLECYAEKIRQIPLSQKQEHQLDSLLLSLYGNFCTTLPECEEIAVFFANLKKSSQQIALLVTQPPEWVTYEGAFDSVCLETLILNWAQDLPESWVAIPTYHAGYRLSEENESILAKCSKIKLLPREWSQAKTEALLPYVDGIVTLSSTVAMSAALLQKKVAVTGISPFRAWAAQSADQIDNAPVFSRQEVLSTLAFLTGTYTWPDSLLKSDPTLLRDIMQKSRTGDISEWLKSITPDALEAKHLFNNFEAVPVTKSFSHIDKIGEPFAKPASEKITVVCVNVGPKYSMDYVNILKNMVLLNLPSSTNVDFFCVTDRSDELPDGVNLIPAEPKLPGWWQKLRLFDPSIGLKGKIIYFDLDVCITSDLTRLIKSHGIINDWNYNAYNSSVMVWNAGEHREVWDKFSYSFVNEKPINYAGPIWTDQDWITIIGGWEKFPDGWCLSYKCHAIEEPPQSCMVVCFHGQPKPHEILTGWVPKIWKRKSDCKLLT